MERSRSDHQSTPDYAAGPSHAIQPQGPAGVLTFGRAYRHVIEKLYGGVVNARLRR